MAAASGVWPEGQAIRLGVADAEIVLRDAAGPVVRRGARDLHQPVMGGRVLLHRDHEEGGRIAVVLQRPPPCLES